MALNTLANVGPMYFVFLIAVKIDVSMLLRTTRKAWSIGLTSFALPLITLSLLLSISKNNSVPLVLAANLSVSFFPVVANALEEIDLTTTELGQLALSLALVNDAINWFFMSVSVSSVQSGIGLRVLTFVAFFAFTVFTIFVVRPGIVLIIKKTPQGKEVPEHFVVLILVGVLVIGFISDSIGTTVFYGALMLGHIIPDGPPLGSILVEKSEFIVSNFFLPLFFARVGYQVDVYMIQNWDAFISLWYILFCGYVAKFVGTVLASLLFKIRPEHAFLLGLIMNNKGIVELIISLEWIDKKVRLRLGLLKFLFFVCCFLFLK